MSEPVESGVVENVEAVLAAEAPVEDAPPVVESVEPEPADEAPETGAADEVEKWKQLSRKNEERAKANAEAAKRLPDVEAELAAAKGRVSELEETLESERRSALRARIQASHGISDEDAELFLTSNDEETLRKQAERFMQRVQTAGNHVPGEGRIPANDGDAEMRQFAEFLSGRR